ncbi:uncharacterized protein LOC108669470 [Hyalella azteca]|uniref:Uncharacterized protein LOC108669470 n=1 Tax=Hyalella azteca TaxID=294128 RepID=A0A8B7NFT7_HYAAZ|nr:uncharacterized protein LOC108669470 [Hyalella azteca]
MGLCGENWRCLHPYHFWVLLLLLPVTPSAKNLSPEARPSPLSGLNSVGTGIGTDHGDLGVIGGSYSQVWTGNRHHHRPPHLMDAPDEVTATIGGNAFLPCAVQHLGDRTVTWMRQQDLHILTAGPLTFSADERFRVLHPEDSDDWTLHIKMVTPKDAGLYECQVNSDPKISREVTLTVKEHSQLDDPGTFLQTTDARLPDYQILPDYDSDYSNRSGRKQAKGRRRDRKCRKRTKSRRSSGQHHAAVHQSVYDGSPFVSSSLLVVLLAASLPVALLLRDRHFWLGQRPWSSNGCG